MNQKIKDFCEGIFIIILILWFFGMLSIYSMAEWEVKIQRDFIDAGTHEWCGDGLFKSFERIGKC